MAAHAQIENDWMRIKCLYYKESNGEWHTGRAEGPVKEAKTLGRTLAREMRDKYGV